MTDEKKVLIIDDEPDIRELLALTLSRMGIKSVVAKNLSEAKNLFNKDKYFLCLTDMRLPDGDGIEFVKYIKKHNPDLPVAVITAFGNIESAVKTLKEGAFDYVSKPINLELLKDLIKTAQLLSKETAHSDHMELLIGKTPEIESLRVDILKLARSQAPVFIHGESGVGKELVANLIHQKGPRASKAFIPVNCGAIPAELMESEFFGYMKGSYTGALKDTEGLFQAAHQGTLFLDEIAELPLAMQVKLLRAIQEKAIKPVGAHKEISVDVRILSASHKNLLKEIEKENFRQDLYYRINVIEIKVPPLKEHPDDIPLLVENILKKLAVDSFPELTDRAMTVLKQYDFPGNIRELENILERAITLCENNVIDINDLQLPELPLQETAIDSTNENTGKDLDDFLLQQQRDVIIEALEKTKWNRTKAAKLLGISFRALRYRLKKLGIE
jgi:two-component system response regulator PilR (NtrC family)